MTYFTAHLNHLPPGLYFFNVDGVSSDRLLSEIDDKGFRGKYFNNRKDFPDTQLPGFILRLFPTHETGNDQKTHGRNRDVHELHHLVWQVIQENGMAREYEPETKLADVPINEAREAFNWLRDELVAYLLTDSGKHMEAIDESSQLMYTENPKLLAAGRTVKTMLMAMLERAKSSDIDPLVFMYSILKSKNFKDMRAQLQNMAASVAA